MGTTVDHAVMLYAVADDPARTVGAGRSEGMDRTFEAVERVALAVHDDVESIVVIIAAHVADSHLSLHSVWVWYWRMIAGCMITG
jgi:hypothetical protein